MQTTYRVCFVLLLLLMASCKVEETNLCGESLDCCEIRLQGQAMGEGSQFCTTCSACQQQAKPNEEHTCPLSTAHADPGECWNTATTTSSALFAHHAELSQGGASSAILKTLSRKATIDLTENLAVAFTAGPTTVDRLEARNGETDYCLTRCESSDPTTASFCDQYQASNDVAYALLDLTATYAGTPDANVRTPFSEVADRYKISHELLCERNDVVVHDGRLSNEGSPCESFVTLSEVGDSSPPRYLWITTPPNLVADIKSSSPIAVFESGKSFHVDPRNEVAAPETKGDVRTVVQTSKKSRLALEISTQRGPACLELRSEAESTNPIDAAMARLDVKDEDLGAAITSIKDDVQQLFALRERVSLRRVEMDVRVEAGKEPAPPLMLTSLVRAAQASSSDLQPMAGTSVEAESSSTIMDDSPAVSEAMREAALLVDIASCHARYTGQWSRVGGVLPRIAPDARFGPNTLRDRNELAGDLLLCRFVGARIPPAVRAELQKLANGELPVHEEATEASKASNGF